MYPGTDIRSLIVKLSFLLVFNLCRTARLWTSFPNLFAYFPVKHCLDLAQIRSALSLDDKLRSPSMQGVVDRMAPLP